MYRGDQGCGVSGGVVGCVGGIRKYLGWGAGGVCGGEPHGAVCIGGIGGVWTPWLGTVSMGEILVCAPEELVHERRCCQGVRFGGERFSLGRRKPLLLTCF